MKTFLLSLFIAASASAQTIIMPVQDLLFDVPNFTAPSFSFNAASTGNYRISDIPKETRISRKEQERKLIDFLWEQYPEAQLIRIFRGTVIIKL
jgi:hypothetical protein